MAQKGTHKPFSSKRTAALFVQQFDGRARVAPVMAGDRTRGYLVLVDGVAYGANRCEYRRDPLTGAWHEAGK